jgi:hypothetical protein
MPSMKSSHQFPNAISITCCAAFMFALRGISSFSPAMPPRFDNFCEQVVGSWGRYGSPIESKINSVGDVEEVMRACGGAVQGIKEISRVDDSSIYHNRADDGFVYFDCGSYTQGPVQVTDDTDGHLPPIRGSLSFSTIPKSRVVFDSSKNSWQSQVHLRSMSINDSPFDKLNKPELDKVMEYELEELDIVWGKETVCRMGSANQPWMLQRAKWEASTLDEAMLIPVADSMKVNSDNLELKGWFYDWDMTKEKAAWESVGLDGLLKKESSQIVKIVAACINTGEVKSLLRCYDDKKMLKAIVLQAGLII